MRAKPEQGTGPAGWQRGVLIAAFIVVLLGLPLALLAASVIGDGAFVTVLVGGITLVIGVLGYGLVRASMSRRQAARTPVTAPPSADLRLVASRLISVEKRVAAISDSAGTDAVAEVTSDLGLLSGLVKGLADTLAQQERELLELRGRVDLLSRHAAQSTIHRVADFDSPQPAKSPQDVPRAARQADIQRLPRLFPTAFPELPHSDLAHPDLAHEPAPARHGVVASRQASIVAANRENRIELHLEPIVSLPQRHTHAYQVLSRLRLADGALIEPHELVPALEGAGELGSFDHSVLSRVLAVAAELEPASRELRLICELTSRIAEGPRADQMLATLVARSPSGARRTTLELGASSWRALSAQSVVQLLRLKAAGVLLCLSRIDEGWPDDALMLPLQPDFIKLSRHAILNGAPHDRVVAGLARLRERGIRVIAEGVDSERDILDLLDFDIPLAQGLAFGASRPLLSEDAAPASRPAMSPPLSAAIDAPLRLRDVVRRVG